MFGARLFNHLSGIGEKLRNVADTVRTVHGKIGEGLQTAGKVLSVVDEGAQRLGSVPALKKFMDDRGITGVLDSAKRLHSSLTDAHSTAGNVIDAVNPRMVRPKTDT
jgi:hypothetical protein